MTSTAHNPGPTLPPCPPSAPSLLLPAFPGAALLVTSPDAPGSKLIIKLKREGPIAGNSEEMPRTQTFFLTGMPLSWGAQCRDGPVGPGVRTLLLAKAGEEMGARKPRGPEVAPSIRAPPPGDTSFACTSKGVYENYRRWQRYKALARRHFPASPDAEALACFFIPVLRSLARLRPDMTLEDGVPRAVQEWDHSTNFERMIFYEMAEKFMEFEAEEEQQIQKMTLLASCSKFQAPPSKPAKPPVSPASESGQQQVYIPKKSACKSHQPRRRQRRPASTPTPGAPREIPAEAVHQYAEIMDGLETSWEEEEEEEEKKEQRLSQGSQGLEDGMLPDPSLQQYIDLLCDDEEFVCKVEAIIHPQFMAHLLSPEKSQDPLDLVDELVEELHLTPSQLTEKRLLALTEEEKNPSVYPTSHSGSTPSQSEEEDEVGVNGKGEGPSCQTTKRPSVNKGFRTGQAELPPSAGSSPQAPLLHPQCADRSFPSKDVRTSSGPSPHQCNSSNTKDANRFPFLKNTVEEETQNSQAGGHAVEASARIQHIKMKAIPNVTGTNHFTRNLTSQGGSEERQGIPRPSTMEHSKQNGSQGRKAKGQEVIPKAIEHRSRATTGRLFNRTQLVRNNPPSVYKKGRKQDGTQQGEVKGLKKTQAIRKNALKGIDERPDVNKILMVGQIAGQSARKLTLNGCRELNVDHCSSNVEQIKGQPQIQDNRGSEDNSNKAELGCQNREMTSHWDSPIKQDSQQLIPFDCEKKDGCRREVGHDQHQFQSVQKVTKCKFTVPATEIENVNPCGQKVARQGSPKPATSRSGNEPNDQIAKVESHNQLHAERKQTKAVTVKNNRPAKTTKVSADKQPLPKQLTLVRQDGQPSADPPRLGTDPACVEPSRESEQLLTSSDPSGIGVLKCKLSGRELEPLQISTVSVLESPSSSIQTDLKTSQNSQPLLIDQCPVTPCMEDLPDDKQALNPTLISSSFVLVVEANGGSCGPSRDHTPGPTSPNVVPASAPLIPQRASSSHDNEEPNQEESESSNSCQFHSSHLEIKIPSKVEDGSVLQKVNKEEEEEDAELSSFSSLLASKLSLSPYNNHGLPPMDRGGTQPSLPTETWQQGASARREMTHDATSFPNKHLEPKPSAQHCCHKRRSTSSGPRRSKRLRNQ
ncbi:NUT family member 1 [Pogona vitticeps]